MVWANNNHEILYIDLAYIEEPRTDIKACESEKSKTLEFPVPILQNSSFH